MKTETSTRMPAKDLPDLYTVLAALSGALLSLTRTQGDWKRKISCFLSGCAFAVWVGVPLVGWLNASGTDKSGLIIFAAGYLGNRILDIVWENWPAFIEYLIRRKTMQALNLKEEPCKKVEEHKDDAIY